MILNPELILFSQYLANELFPFAKIYIKFINAI
jgi:hypothetical protein